MKHQWKLCIALVIVLLSSSYTGLVSATSPESLEDLTGFFYNSELSVRGNTTGNITLNETVASGDLTLAGEAFEFELARWGTLNLSFNNSVYRGESQDSGQPFRTTVFWDNVTGVVHAWLHVNTTTYAAYLHANETRAVELEEDLMANRTDYSFIERLIHPTWLDDPTSLPEDLPSRVEDVESVLAGADLLDGLLSSDGSSTGEQWRGTFYTGQGMPNDDPCFEPGMPGDGSTTLSITSDKRDQEMPETFDEVHEDKTHTWTDVSVWLPGFQNEPTYYCGDDTGAVQWGEANMGLQIRGSENPLRLSAHSARPAEGTEQDSWSLDIGIGYGFVGVGLGIEIDDSCQGDTVYQNNAGTEVSKSSHDLEGWITWCENEWGDSTYGDDLPKDASSALGLQVEVRSIAGDEGEFPPARAWGKIDYHRSPDCHSQSYEYFWPWCASETFTSRASPRDIWSHFQWDRWGDDKRISENIGYNVGDRKITDAVAYEDSDGDGELDSIIPDAANTSWCWADVRGQELYNWWELLGPIEAGHDFEFRYARWVWSDWDEGYTIREPRGKQTISIPHPALSGEPYWAWVHMAPHLDIPKGGDYWDEYYNYVGPWDVELWESTASGWLKVGQMAWHIKGCK